MRFLYTTSDSLSSKLITGFDSGGVSHGGLEFPDHRPGMVLDSTFMHGGVHWWPRAEWEVMHGRRLTHNIDLRVPNEARAFSFAAEQEGKPYDISAIFGMSILRDWQDPAKWYCFELQIAVALAGGMQLAGSASEIGGRLSLFTAHAWALGRDVTLNPSRYAQT